LYYEGADVHALDHKNRSALQIAIENKKENVIKMFSEKNLFSNSNIITSIFIDDHYAQFKIFLFFFLNIICQLICFNFILKSI
jgi:hypothetical protein